MRLAQRGVCVQGVPCNCFTTHLRDLAFVEATVGICAKERQHVLHLPRVRVLHGRCHTPCLAYAETQVDDASMCVLGTSGAAGTRKCAAGETQVSNGGG